MSGAAGVFRLWTWGVFFLLFFCVWGGRITSFLKGNQDTFLPLLNLFASPPIPVLQCFQRIALRVAKSVVVLVNWRR